MNSMKMKGKKLFALLLAGFLACGFVGCGESAGGSGGNESGAQGGSGGGSNEEEITGNWYDDENFTPVIRFTVTADTHIGTGTTASYPWAEEMFDSVWKHSYAYADAQEDYNKLDAVVNVGDSLDYGLLGEYENLIRIYKDNIREGETEYLPVLAGHELIRGEVSDFESNFRMKTCRHEIINGYHLLIVGNGGGSAREPLAGFDWLREEVEEAYNDDPYKPIFVFQHHPINDTIPSSNDNRASAQYDAIYKNYPNIILFTAHTHVPGSEPANILQNDYTMLGVASTAYNEYGGFQKDLYYSLPVFQGLKTVDDTIDPGYSYNNAIDAEHKGIGEFFIVEADAKGRTRVMIYNIYENGWRADIDGEGTMAYYFEDVTDKSTWLYTDARWNENSAPEFPMGAEATVTNNAGGNFAVQFPQAKGKYGVLAYDLFLTDNASGERRSCRIFSLQWFAHMPETRSHEFKGLTVGNEYTLKIEPVNSFCKYGQPLTVTFTAA